MPDPIVCTPKSLPRSQLVKAAATASEINPVNHPPLHQLSTVLPGFTPTKEFIAVLTTKYWHAKGVRLTMGFLDNPPADLRAHIIAHMNAWSSRLNVSFTESNTEAKVRIARTEGSGYWSYLGTDILSIASDEATMNLEAFTMDTPESEFIRVVRHETGHTLGCPHEHMRRELVERIDPDKAIEYFGLTQGWTPDQVRQQVLTPLEDSSLIGTSHSDPNSIMCYQIPGTITKDGKPILGGTDIDPSDFDFMSGIYPKPDQMTVSAGPVSPPSQITTPTELSATLARAQQERDVLKKALAIMVRE